MDNEQDKKHLFFRRFLLWSALLAAALFLLTPIIGWSIYLALGLFIVGLLIIFHFASSGLFTVSGSRRSRSWLFYEDSWSSHPFVREMDRQEQLACQDSSKHYRPGLTGVRNLIGAEKSSGPLASGFNVHVDDRDN